MPCRYGPRNLGKEVLLYTVYCTNHLRPIKTMPDPWFTYIVRCIDASLYTGVTTDLSRRLAEHNSARGGARYTRARQPVQLVFAEKLASRSLACRREYAIKKLSATAKKRLLSDRQSQDCSIFLS